VGFRPASRREGLLDELCTKGGFCNCLNADDLVDGLSRQDIVRMVFVAEGFGDDPAMWERRLREPMERMVDDWLFEPNGRGAKSGLPR
jgi:hypothetical protein